jgi:hypothetical protein
MQQQNRKHFTQNELVIFHLVSDLRDGTPVPVSGVVVQPGTVETLIKIRDKAGHIREVMLPNDLLSSR